MCIASEEHDMFMERYTQKHTRVCDMSMDVGMC